VGDNERKLRSIFAEVLRVGEEEICDQTAYEKTMGWDSVAHMTLVAALDFNFNLMIETDDVLDLSSYPKAKEILRKYGVQI